MTNLMDFLLYSLLEGKMIYHNTLLWKIDETGSFYNDTIWEHVFQHYYKMYTGQKKFNPTWSTPLDLI